MFSLISFTLLAVTTSSLCLPLCVCVSVSVFFVCLYVSSDFFHSACCKYFEPLPVPLCLCICASLSAFIFPLISFTLLAVTTSSLCLPLCFCVSLSLLFFLSRS